MESPASVVLEPPAPRRPIAARISWAACSPCLAAAVALLLHHVLPDQQTSFPSTGRYVLLLEILLGLGVLGIVLQLILPKARPFVSSKAPLLALAIVAFCAWDLITLKFAWMPLPYFPGPDMVLRGLVDEWRPLLINASHSLLLLASGYGIGTALGLISGVSMGWSSRVRYWGMPVLKLVGPIPATALIPLAMAVFSSSFFSGAALIALAVWFPVTMLTASGVSNVRMSYLDVARTMGASRLFLIFRVALPAATPSIFIGLFMGLGAAFLTLIAAETVGVSAGLGYYLKWRQAYCEYDKVYAALLVMAIFFSAVMTALFKVRDRLLVWQKGVIKW
ncbi:MAG TPA: ABC transporter permease [Tepidisphaeraceae bacterium]|nr:ABC transporter permease [Tepidisphaeraceae bacterium]